MKKVSALLLTAVLGSSMVFAGISGSVTTTYGLDLGSDLTRNLRDKSIGFLNENDDAIGEVTLSLENETIGEGDIHAEISGSLSLITDEIKLTDGTDEDDNDDNFKFKLDDNDLSASIVGPNWAVEITDAADITDFAEDYNNDDGDAYFNLEFDSSDVAGVTASYTYEEGETVTVALGQMNEIKDGGMQDNYVAILSPEFMLAEGLTTQAALAGQYAANGSANKSAVGMGATIAYMNEDAGYDITANMDAGIYKDDFQFEASIVGNYSLATVNAYFNTDAEYDTDVDVPDQTDRDGYIFAGLYGDNLLSAEVIMDFAELDENVPVTLTVEGRGMQVMGSYDSNGDQVPSTGNTDKFSYKMDAELAYALAMGDSTLTIGAKAGYDFDDSADWMAGGSLEYAPMSEAYTATVSLDYLHAPNTLSPELDIESTTLVDGATLNLGYYGSVYGLNSGAKHDFGMIKTTCEIEF
ncbi:MAG: hypothetical protein ACRQFF_07575 [Sphaerochaeta sp.]